MNHSVLGPVCRGQWSEEETYEEEEEEKVSPESGPKEDDEMEGDLRINVDEEETFVLPPAGEMEQDILLVQGEPEGDAWEKALPGPRKSGSSSLTGPHAQVPDLQRVHKRIQDIVGVLRDFGTQREEGRSRSEYLQRLRKDLATYYSYGDFLLGKLMDLFPLSEVPTCRSDALHAFLSSPSLLLHCVRRQPAPLLSAFLAAPLGQPDLLPAMFCPSWWSFWKPMRCLGPSPSGPIP